jgi:hypothetical protein
MAKDSATVVLAQTRCCRAAPGPRRWLRHHEKAQRTTVGGVTKLTQLALVRNFVDDYRSIKIPIVTPIIGNRWTKITHKLWLRRVAHSARRRRSWTPPPRTRSQWRSPQLGARSRRRTHRVSLRRYMASLCELTSRLVQTTCLSVAHACGSRACVHWRYGTTVHAAAGSHRCQGHRSYVPRENVCGPKIVVRVLLSRCYRVVVDSCPREITLGSLMRSAGPRVPHFVIC